MKVLLVKIKHLIYHEVELTKIYHQNTADVEVGDTLIQGRFGNFITLTSRQSQGLDESPRITINNQRSIVDLESIDDIGLINVESDEILMTALTDEVNIRA